MRVATEFDAEIKRLKQELENEQKMKQMLDQSINDLCKTVESLEIQAQSTDVGDEDEWKVRYYTQVEVNRQLEHQRDWLRERAQAAKVNNKEEYLADLDLDSLTENQLIRYLKQLEKDRNIVHNEIRDTEWKLDQESKVETFLPVPESDIAYPRNPFQAFHKFNDIRKAYMTEITDAVLNLESLRNRIRLIETGESGTIAKCPRQLKYLNIQPDQRVIDPRKGPIKKTAAIRSLPKLETPTKELLDTPCVQKDS